MESIARRKLMQGGAALAVAASMPVAADAARSEDAVLLSLWEEWKAQLVRSDRAITDLSAIEAKVNEAAGPYWTLSKIDVSTGCAVFISSWAGDNSTKTVPVKAESYRQAECAAEEAREALWSERKRVEKAAKERFHHAAAERLSHRENARLLDLERRIANEPAIGLHGMAVKLALCKYDEDLRDPSPEDDAVNSTYEALVRLSGFDPISQVEV